MKNAWKLFTYKDTPVYLKYWFLGLILFIPIPWFISIFIGILIHEISHVSRAKKLGYKSEHIFINVFHGGALIDSSYTKNDKHAISIVLAGPLSNLLLSLGSFGIATLLESLTPINIESPIIEYLALFTAINLLLFLVNLLPIYPLDGGRISRSLLRMAFGDKKGKLINGIISIVLATSLLVYSVISFDIILIVLSVIMILASYGDIKDKENEQSIN